MDHVVFLAVTTNRCAVAAAALYLYDTLLTVSDSIELIWQRKISGASMLYIVNRYIMVPYLVLELVALDEEDCESAYAMLHIVNAITCILLIVCGVLSAIRVYALEHCVSDWKLPALVSSLVLFQFGTSIYTYSRTTPEALPPPLYCAMHSTVPAGLDDAVKILTRIFNIIHDALILFLTWYRTRGGLLDLARRTEEGDSVVTRLLLNGAIYFIVHLFLNLADAVLTVTMIFESTSIFNAIFTPLILSHFFLSIRKAQYANEGGYAEESKVSALEFASFEADDDNCARSASRESEEDWDLASEPTVI
ncbi:uncharacterized protein C8Q71DRAFT_736072 [Rhodofomes roseus]|uniref:DUF6533 domain-containing protein n=1 Tax=Rhodofomes roseus TaxID=34475 RepID=A0ABQ8KX80_9APHY|nr:uncharacterized protein C8Q71DRAFT_736072 [Rhodofomes roseus]KAH9843144.1 hypothetical protein C8Q71DRAFT_736072 [Rhodofomes roseus]